MPAWTFRTVIVALLLWCCLFLSPALFSAAQAAETSVPQPAKPQNGVFFLAKGYTATLLELKDGKFRYWFETDLKPGPAGRYPVTGKYVVEGDTITLKSDKVEEEKWTFRQLGKTVTLWRETAVTIYDYDKKLDYLGILYQVNDTAEKAWAERMGKYLK